MLKMIYLLYKCFVFNFKFTEKREIGPIVGAHGGPNCVGLAFFEKEETK